MSAIEVQIRHSPSSLKLHDTCPHRYYRERILKDVTPGTSAPAEWGKLVHSQLEKAIKGEADWPEQWAHVSQAFRVWRLKYTAFQAERRLALDRALKPTDFYADDAWVRGIVDLILWDSRSGTMMLVDWKTGSVRPADAKLQMQFYALCAFRHSDKVRHVVTALEWIKHRESTRKTYTRDAENDLAEIIREKCEHVEHQVALMPDDRNTAEIDRLFPRKASGLCRGWCGIYDCPLNSGREKTQTVRPIRFRKKSP